MNQVDCDIFSLRDSHTMYFQLASGSPLTRLWDKFTKVTDNQVPIWKISKRVGLRPVG